MYDSSFINLSPRQSSEEHHSDEMIQALHDFANKVNLIVEDDNDNNVEPVDDEATMFELFDEL